MKSPIISIITITWNSSDKLKIFFYYLKKQNFNKSRIQLIIVDGGSTDDTQKICSKFRSEFINFSFIRTKIIDQEPKRAIGVKASKGKYICFLDPDNYVIDNNWLNKMILPLENNYLITGAQTLYYHYDKKDKLINRYFSLFGVNDPVVFYLKKADRIPHYKKTWEFNKNYVDKSEYFLVNFNKEIPTMGCNGVIFRRKHYIKAKISIDTFFHIDIIQDLVLMGYSKYAIVKNEIFHDTGDSFFKSIIKRVIYMNRHYFNKHLLRRYLVFNYNNKEDVVNLIKFCFYTITIVQPIALSIRGFIAIRDVAWFMHWPMCLGFLMIYFFSIINRLILRLKFLFIVN